MSMETPEERVENVIPLSPNHDRGDRFCPTFYYGLVFKHPLKTHVIEAEGGTVLKNTHCLLLQRTWDLVPRTHMEAYNSV